MGKRLGSRIQGKKITMAETQRVESMQEIAQEVMRALFGMEPGSYLITDESSLSDFRGVKNLELADMHERIQSVFGVDVSVLGSNYLVDIFALIQQFRVGPPN